MSSEFEEKGYTKVSNFLDEDTVKTMSSYMKNTVNRGLCDSESDSCVVCSYKTYADPLVEILLENLLPEVERVVDKDLYPTYSFFRVYVKGDALHKHTDRPSCEYSVSVNIANDGGNWPIYMQRGEEEPSRIVLNPGDAVIYKGCEVNHWRSTAESTNATAQFMLHYVDKNGPFSDYKFDQRASLGLRR